MPACDDVTCLGRIHDDSGDKVQEDVIAVGPHGRVVERHLQLVHGFQQQTLGFVVQVFKRCFLFKETTGVLKCMEIVLRGNDTFYKVYKFAYVVRGVRGVDADRKWGV